MKLPARIGFALMVFVHMAAQAQQPVAPPTPEAQALAQKLMAEINSNIQCTAAGITLQQRLVAAEAEVKRLKEKYEKDAPK